MEPKTTLTFCGGVGSVTGANFLIETDNIKILVDCGMFQGTDLLEQKNRSVFAYNPKQIDILIVTHAHADHIGRVPRLVKEGFQGVIYSTHQTKELSEIMFDDAVQILRHNAEKNHTSPLYEKEDAIKAIKLWKSADYHEIVNLTKDIKLNFKDSGHILGSAIVELTRNNKKVVFTGDLGNSPDPILRDTETVDDANYMVIETVYGDRNHEPKDVRDNDFRNAIKKTIAAGGAAVIPTFSLERTQVILYEVNNMVESGELQKVPIFLDSPLAIKLTQVYRESKKYFNEQTQKQIESGDDVFTFRGLHITERPAQSEAIVSAPSPKIIIASSGMSTAGRVIGHERHYLPDPKSSIILVGYQGAGTIGRELKDGAREVNIYGNRVPVRAKIYSIEGYSAHKDSDHLVEFISHSENSLKKIFLTMGEEKSRLFFAQKLYHELGIKADIPQEGEKFDLEF